MGDVAIYYGEVIEKPDGDLVVRVHHDGAVDEYPAVSREDGMITLEAKLAVLEQNGSESPSAAPSDQAEPAEAMALIHAN